MRTSVVLIGTLAMLSAFPQSLAALSPAFTMEILDVEAERMGAQVLVTVRIGGTALDLLALGGPVMGEVDVTSPTPCWPDFPGACADVLWTQTRSFSTVPLAATWEADVGPFEYPSAPVGLACALLEIAARASSGASSATDADTADVCA